MGFSDYQLIERGFRSTNARWQQGDFNEDGVVSAADVSILLQNYGRRLDGSMAAVSVSEQQCWRRCAERGGGGAGAGGIGRGGSRIGFCGGMATAKVE